MTSLTVPAAVLIAVAAAVCPHSLPAQKADTLIARPGNGVVKGFLLTPGRRQFRVLSRPCEADTHTAPHEVGSFLEHTEPVGDTLLLLIQEWPWLDRAPVFDTTGYDRSTLGAHWSRAHSQNWFVSW